MCSNFMDDVSLSGHISTVAAHVETIIAAAEEIGLRVNRNECEEQTISTLSHQSSFLTDSDEYSGKTYLSLKRPLTTVSLLSTKTLPSWIPFADSHIYDTSSQGGEVATRTAALTR